MYDLLKVPFHVTGAEPGADSRSPESLKTNWLQEMGRKQRGLKLNQTSQGTDSQAQDAQHCVSQCSMFICV